MSDAGIWARLTENTTSSAVNGVPSWNFTFGRSFMRHWVGAGCSQLTARPGTMLRLRSRATRYSYTWPLSELVRLSLRETGSRVCMSPCEAQRRVCPCAAAPRQARANANNFSFIACSRRDEVPASLSPARGSEQYSGLRGIPLFRQRRGEGGGRLARLDAHL